MNEPLTNSWQRVSKGTYRLSFSDGKLFAKHIPGHGNKIPPEFDFLFVPDGGENLGFTYVPKDDKLIVDNPGRDLKILKYSKYLAYPGDLANQTRSNLENGIELLQRYRDKI